MKFKQPHILRMAAVIVLLISMPACTREAKKERALKAAMEHFNKGDLVASEIELKNALQAEPSSGQAIKQMGIIRQLQGANFEAAEILSQAMRLDPQDDEVGVALAKALFSLGYIADSRRITLEVLDRSHSNGEALMLLADTSMTPEWVEEFKERLRVAGPKTSESRIAEALVELRSGRIASGTALVDEVIKSGKNVARAHALKASILASEKEPDRALAEMKLAAEAAGPRSAESIGYARMLMGLDKKDEAIAFLEKVTAATPDYLPAWATLGNIAFGDKDNEKATEYFSKVLAKDPVDANTAVAQAQIWMNDKTPEKAVAVMETLTHSLPSRPALDLMLAKAYLAANNIPKGTAALDAVLAVAPNSSEAGAFRAQLFLSEGKVSEGVRILEGIRAREPKNPIARDLLIQGYRVSGRNDDAVVLMREKADSDATNPQSKLELGQMLSSMGNDAEARSIFENAVEDFSANLGAVSNLAAIDMKQGKTDAAMSKIDGYIKAHPESSEALVFKAGIQVSIKQPDQAEISLNKALELKPDNKQAYLLLLSINQGEEALAVFDRFLKAFPKDGDVRLSRGFLLQQLGRAEEARTVFQSLLDEGLQLSAAHNNLAALESGPLKDLPSAVEHARQARSLDPEQPAIADTLGWIEWQMGNYTAALPLLSEAAEKLSNSAEVLYHLGMAQYAMGQSADATITLTKATSGEADFPGKEQALKQLAMLQNSESVSLEDLEKQLAANPGDALSRLRLAQLLADADRVQDAFDAYQKVIDANPSIPAAWIGQARLLAGPLNDPAKALVAATKARELAPTDPRALAALGSAKLLNGNQEEAYGLLKDASGRLSDDASVLYDQARAAYSLGRVEEASVAMKRVSVMGAPESAAAATFVKLTAPDAAESPGIAAEVAQVLAKNPTSAPALMLQAELDTAAGKNPEATYLEILKVQPHFDPARVCLAAIYLEDPAKLDEAQSLATKARSNMPNNLELTHVLAMVSFKKGDLTYAGQLLSELAIKRPLTPDEELVRGLAYAGSKEPEKAKQSLEDAIKGGLSDADATRAKEALAELAKPAEKKDAE